jgi:hypothetical protein
MILRMERRSRAGRGCLRMTRTMIVLAAQAAKAVKRASNETLANGEKGDGASREGGGGRVE